MTPVSDILDDLADAFNDEMQLTPKQADAPVPRRRGRPLKSDPTAPSNLKVTGVAPKPVVVPMPPKGTIAAEMASLYTFAAIPLMAVKPKAAEAMMASADDIGKAWEQVAERNPKVRAALLGVAQTSTWAALAMAHLPILMAVMADDPKEKRDDVQSVPRGKHANRVGQDPQPGEAVLYDLRERVSERSTFGGPGAEPQADS